MPSLKDFQHFDDILVPDQKLSDMLKVFLTFLGFSGGPKTYKS